MVESAVMLVTKIVISFYSHAEKNGTLQLHALVSGIDLVSNLLAAVA